MPWLLLVGMMTVTGTRKPVWRAFELLMDAGTERLEVTGVTGQDLVTCRENGRPQPAHPAVALGS